MRARAQCLVYKSNYRGTKRFNISTARGQPHQQFRLESSIRLATRSGDGRGQTRGLYRPIDLPLEMAYEVVLSHTQRWVLDHKNLEPCTRKNNGCS